MAPPSLVTITGSRVRRAAGRPVDDNLSAHTAPGHRNPRPHMNLWLQDSHHECHIFFMGAFTEQNFESLVKSNVLNFFFFKFSLEPDPGSC